MGSGTSAIVAAVSILVTIAGGAGSFVYGDNPVLSNLLSDAFGAGLLTTLVFLLLLVKDMVNGK